MGLAWKTIRIFISSTFLDMQAERDQLVQVVFPALREKLLPYHIYFDDIDLRWGVTQEQLANRLALDICLERIDQSRPYFLGLLGNRYGYPIEEIDELTRAKYPLLDNLAGKSMTELEFRYGLSLHNGCAPKGVVFIRDALRKEDIPAALSPLLDTGQEQIGALKNWLKDQVAETSLFSYQCTFSGVRIEPELIRGKISTEDYTTVQNYQDNGLICKTDFTALNMPLQQELSRHGAAYMEGLADFARDVEAAIWSMIDPDLPEMPGKEAIVTEPDFIREDTELEYRFMQMQTRIYVPREKFFTEVNHYINGDILLPLIITGAGGGGKSAAMAWFCQSFATHSATLLITHFCGVSPISSQTTFLLRKLCTRLISEFGFKEVKTNSGAPLEETVKVAGTLETLITQFNDLIYRIPADVKVVFALDGLDNLDDAGKVDFMDWLPVQLPPSVRIVMTAFDDPSGNNGLLRKLSSKRPANYLAIEPLTTRERSIIIGKHSALSGRQLTTDQMKLLTSNPATGNPLFLYVALDELKQFHSFAQLADRIRLMPSGGEALHGIILQMIARLENDFGPGVTRQVLTLLAVSRKGLSEKELAALLSGDESHNAPPGTFYPLVRQLRPYLQFRGELLAFLHRDLPASIERHYLNGENSRREVHNQLATFFTRQADGWTDVPEGPLKPNSYRDQASLNPRKLEELPWHLVRITQLSENGAERSAAQEAAFTLFTSMGFLGSKIQYNADELLGDIGTCMELFDAATAYSRSLDFIRENLTAQKDWLQLYPAGLTAFLHNRALFNNDDPETKDLLQKRAFQVISSSGQPPIRLHRKRRQEPFDVIPFTTIPHCGVYSSTGQCISISFFNIEIWDKHYGLRSITPPPFDLLPMLVVEENPELFMIYYRDGDPQHNTQGARIRVLNTRTKTIKELISIPGYWIMALARSAAFQYKAVTREGDLLDIDLEKKTFTITFRTGHMIGAACVEKNGRVTYTPEKKHQSMQQQEADPAKYLNEQFFAQIPIYQYTPGSDFPEKIGIFQNQLELLPESRRNMADSRALIDGFKIIQVVDDLRVLCVSTAGSIFRLSPFDGRFYSVYQHTSTIQGIDVIDDRRLLITAGDSIILDTQMVDGKQDESNIFVGERIEAITSLPDDQLLTITAGKIWVYNVFNERLSILKIMPKLENVARSVFLPDGTIIPVGVFKKPLEMIDFENGYKKWDSVDLYRFTVTRKGELYGISYQQDSNQGKKYDPKKMLFLDDIKFPKDVGQVALRDDGIFAMEVSGLLKLWDLSTGQERVLGDLSDRITELGFACNGAVAACTFSGTVAIWDRDGKNPNFYNLNGEITSFACHWNIPLITVAMATGELVTLRIEHPVKDGTVTLFNAAKRHWRLPILSDLSKPLFRKTLYMYWAISYLLGFTLWLLNKETLRGFLIGGSLASIFALPFTYIYHSRKTILARLKIQWNRFRKPKVRKPTTNTDKNDFYARNLENIHPREISDAQVQQAFVQGGNTVTWLVTWLPLIFCAAVYYFSRYAPAWLTVTIVVLTLLYSLLITLQMWVKLNRERPPSYLDGLSEKMRRNLSLPDPNRMIIKMEPQQHRKLLYGLLGCLTCLTGLVICIAGIIPSSSLRYLYLIFAISVLTLRLVYSNRMPGLSSWARQRSGKLAARIADMGRFPRF